MASATPPLRPQSHSRRRESSKHRLPTFDEDGHHLNRLPSFSKPSQNLRGDQADDTDASSVSDATESIHRRRRKQVRNKSSRPVNQRASSCPQSSLSSNNDFFLPSLGRILEGRPSRETSAKSTTSSARSGSKHRVHHKYASARNGRIGRHHLGSQTELQSRVRSLVSPSLQSVLSTLTAATSSSSGSNGSGSTVTQSSYTKSQSSKEGTSASGRRPRSPLDIQKRRQRRKERQEDAQPDVFAFMEEEPTPEQDLAWQPNSEPSTGKGPRPQTPAMQGHRSSADPFVSPRPIRVASWQSQDQLHSDSGISVRGSSPESVGRRASLQPSLKPEEELKSKADSTAAAAREHIDAATSWQRRWSTTSTGSVHPSTFLPQAYPATSMVPYAQPPPAYPGQVVQSDRRVASTQQERKASGYDLLASTLSDAHAEDGKVACLYRRFGRLNHRILLHLQDEIAEMEEILQGLDASIARHKPTSNAPESRRSEARYSNELTYQRTELLGRIFVKIKQYNDALSSYDSVSKQAQPARQEDVDRYRAFTSKATPIAAEELRFLEHPDDLVHLSGPSPCPAPAANAAQQAPRPVTTIPALILGPPAAMLVAFVMFSVATNAAVRAFLFLVFSGAGYARIRFTGLGREVMNDHERHVCLGFYVCLLACIATAVG